MTEGVDCYVDGRYKAAAVMIGASSESLILELAQSVSQKVPTLGRTSQKDLQDWRMKKVLDALRTFFLSNKGAMPRGLAEAFEAYWAAFAHQIRTARSEAGHPSSIEPVTHDTVHASLLIFPELARLQNNLLQWVHTNFNAAAS